MKVQILLSPRFQTKGGTEIFFITAFVALFLIPDVIIPIAFRFIFIRTTERIEAAESRAIAGKAQRVNKPREVGSRSWFLMVFARVKFNSGIIGK